MGREQAHLPCEFERGVSSSVVVVERVFRDHGEVPPLCAKNQLAMQKTAYIAALLFASIVYAEAEDGFTPIFDGKTFDGWEGSMTMFYIEDGAVVAGTLEAAIPHNYFLCTKKVYGDFELRLKFKLLGKGANAGIQIRSKRIPNHHEVSGYQADLGDGWWGSLYDESRRNQVLAKADEARLGEVLHRDDWNDYTIRCQGKRIQLWINGQQTVDYTEPDDKIEQRGVIGLQIHGGGPGQAWYKDVRIKEL